MSNSTVPITGPTVQSVFGYNANMPMAWIAGVVLSITTLIHISQYFAHRAWYFWVFMIGACMEVAGYWTRVVAIRNPANNAALSMMYFLITLAPSFIAAGCYMSFGRTIYWVTPEVKRGARYTWIPARWLSTFFISFDFLGFTIQIIGIFVLIANVNKTGRTPDEIASTVNLVFNILRVGFIIQIICFGIFFIIALHFMIASKAWQYDWLEREGSRWRKIGWTVVGATGFLTIRSLERTLLFTLNRGDNYLRYNEWTFYMFDMLPILAVLVLFNFIHPGRFLPKEYMTIRHGYKQEGFRPASEKTVIEQPAAGYSRVTLVPPPLAPPMNSAPQTVQVPGSGMTFTDPWNNRPSMGDRY